MSALTFRTATAEDVDAVVDLVQSAYRGPASRRGWTTEADLLEGQRIDRAMLDEVLAQPATTVLLAERDGTLLACCELERPERGGVAHLGMFAVDPDRQGGGVGRSVLQHAERLAGQDWGAGSIELSVIEQRSELIAWYERNGYLRTGRHEDFPYDDERFGRPIRDDLRFVVLAKPLERGA
jgi:ribosomal protein S18 acetylase RimI-like enzyme